MPRKASMSLATVLEPYRPSLEDIALDKLPVDTPENLSEVRGRIAEALMREWLSRCSKVAFDTEVPRRVNGYYLTQEKSGIVVHQKNPRGRTVTEYDFLIFFEGRPYIIEVKARKVRPQPSNRKHPFYEKLARKKWTAEHIYSTHDIGIALAVPFMTFGESKRDALQKHFPSIEYIDLGISSPRRLTRAVERYCLGYERRVG